MNDAGQSICLCMIVRDEAAVIRRCLDSVRPIIDDWVIVDTGSCDDTIAIIHDRMHGVPGRLYKRPWRDFARNRSEALVLARSRADYSLIIDADDTLEIEADFTLPPLTHDSYRIEILHGQTRFSRPQFISNRRPWRYQGVLHEFLSCDGAQEQGDIPGLRIRTHPDGARRRDPETYRRDAAVLETALEQETDPFLIARYHFYLAQSYRDCGALAAALENYLIRAGLGFWQEEVFVSLYQAARLKAALLYPDEAVIETYLRATAASPSRAEALHGASRFCRDKGRNEEGYQFAKRGLALPRPADALFLEPWIYDYGLLDELAVNGYWSGRYRDSLDASLTLLSSPHAPPGERDRIAANARHALKRLPRDPDLGLAGREDFVAQHAMQPPRPLRSRLFRHPRILLAILAKQKERSLPLYLDCIEALDYPKKAIVLHIRTNNNTDGTEAILRDWITRVRPLYARVILDAGDIAAPVETFAAHDWNPLRFRVLGQIRNMSLRHALDQGCDFYFVSGVDNFLRPCTLTELVALDLPIVAPLLRSIVPERFYANYHSEVDAHGYFRPNDQYQWILNRWIRGVIEVPVVHCTYLVRADALEDLTYQDGTDRLDYVIFSDSARKAAIPQYIDNRQVYGYITFDESSEFHTENGVERARLLLRAG